MAVPDGSVQDGKRCRSRLEGNGEFVVYSACLRLCALLCLRQVVLTRLPVGHTHEDVDQKFSVTARVRKHANNNVPRILLGA